MQATLDQNGKTSQRKVCAPLISSICVDIRPKLLRLTNFATINLEETNGEATRPTPRRCEVFAIFSCKSAPHRTRICTCQRADDCGCCLPPNTRIREDFAVQARNARIGTIRGLERDWVADVPCYYNHHRPDNVDVVVTVVVVVDSAGGGDGDALIVFASVFQKHILIMPFCYTVAQRQTHFKTRVDAPKHPERKYESTAKFTVPIANLDYSTFYFAILIVR
ncbi:hypothetical protein ALC56_12909 [Trachymyrmex septentrionalis]|uniref:Uncharacterized protein n=1 Tax=Trachymyrmex septentrionalis TaxID=34720 RepID=A0A151JTD8_9HYME|nr:hypothetical protein ALC56_12909 [Trachymyrmex septentrionalis]